MPRVGSGCVLPRAGPARRKFALIVVECFARPMSASSAPASSRNPQRSRAFADDYIRKHELQKVFEETINQVIAEDAEDPLFRASELLIERAQRRAKEGKKQLPALLSRIPTLQRSLTNFMGLMGEVISTDQRRMQSIEAVVSISEKFSVNISAAQLEKVMNDLRTALTKPWGLHVWFSTEIEDPDERLREWTKRVKTARVAICIITEGYQSSFVCREEFRVASCEHSVVIPVMHSDAFTLDHSFKYRLSSLEVVNYREGASGTWVQELERIFNELESGGRPRRWRRRCTTSCS